MSMRTPYRRVTGLGSAKEGTGHFVRQRVTAMSNIPLTLFLVWFLVRIAGAEQAEIAALVSNPLIAGGLVLAVISVSWHMRIGVQVVIEDYVHGPFNRVALLTANMFLSIGLAALCIVSILKLSFGG